MAKILKFSAVDTAREMADQFIQDLRDEGFGPEEIAAVLATLLNDIVYETSNPEQALDEVAVFIS